MSPRCASTPSTISRAYPHDDSRCGFAAARPASSSSIAAIGCCRMSAPNRMSRARLRAFVRELTVCARSLVGDATQVVAVAGVDLYAGALLEEQRHLDLGA